MKFVVSSDIRVQDYTEELQNWCDENLTVDNPEYINREKRGLWLGRTPKKLYLYERVNDKLVLPFGCLQTLWEKYRGKAQFIPCFASRDKVNYGSAIRSLYDYQERAVEAAIKARNGVIVAPCGSGKTVMALELAARLGLRTLFLTHKADLLEQAYNTARANFDLTDKDYGKITAGKVEIGKVMTFATVQTMSKINLAPLKITFDVIICDEAHHVCGTPTSMTQFYYVMSNLSARYKYGMTATPKRSDGLHKTMFNIIGDKICEITKADIADKICPVRVEIVQSHYAPNDNFVLDGDGTIMFSSLLKDLTESTERNRFLTDTIRNLDGSVLVLSDRRAHLQSMSDLLGEPKSVIVKPLTNSDKIRRERREQLRQLNDGELRVMFATYQLAKEGLDIPNLRYVVLATPSKDEITVTQSCGRVGRAAKGKEYGTVIDVVDDFGLLYGYAKLRKRYYKKQEYTVTEHK